jgi:anaerobic selenocysteine-containing dehydrogenase
MSAKDIRRIAIEFASTKPATTYTYRGPCMHLYGSYGERCCMLLPIITANIEVKGGYCLPRGKGYDQPKPKPHKGKSDSYILHSPNYPLAAHKVCQSVPFWIMDGKQKVSVLINYFGAESYTHPATTIWTKLYKDEKLIPYSFSVSNQMNETVALMDLILPGVSYLERHDPESMPSSLYPWVGMRQPVVKPLGESIENREIMKMIIHELDPDGSRGMKKYWDFSDGDDMLRHQFDHVAGLKEAGGYDFLKKNGVWPIYGKLDKQTGRMVGKDGNEIPVEFGLPFKPDKKGKAKVKGKRYAGFGTGDGKIHIYAEGYKKYGFNPLPVFKALPDHWNANGSSKLRGAGDVVMTTFKWAAHTQSRTPNVKLLTEIVHRNPVWINTQTAKKLGIGHGDLVRITTSCGHIVNRAHVTEGVHPKVICQSNTCGTKFGRYAQGKKGAGPYVWGGIKDPDLKNIWWGQNGEVGVNANPITPVIVDPIGGGQGWYDVVAKVEKAHSGDKYGDTVVDDKAHWDAFHKTEEYAYTGKMHRKMHPEVKVGKLPKPGMGGGGGH